MATRKKEQHSYSVLSGEDQESIEFIRDSEETAVTNQLERRPKNSRCKKILPWATHLIFIIAYISGYLIWKKENHVIERFHSSSDAPINYHNVQFANNTGDDTTPFQGPSNPETDAAWSKLLNVGPGLIWIDDEVAKGLPKSTTPRVNGDGYVGVVEMFHQLHCLNRIRMLFYNNTRNLENESAQIFKDHTEHCFDYLRETLMCHGDLDIMSMNWLPEQKMYTAQFDVIKQCRNFDLIKEWTKEHQTGWWPKHP